jgi:hypothetical protein
MRIPPECTCPATLQYRQVASLGTQLERYKRVFHAERMLVLVYDDFVADPGSCYRRALEFLEVADDKREHFPSVNSAKSHRSRVIGRLVLRPPPGLRRIMSLLRRWSAPGGVAYLQRLKASLTVSQPRRQISRGFYSQLLSELEPEIAKLEELLGRDFTAWRQMKE